MNLEAVLAAQRAAFLADPMPTLARRKDDLRRLRTAVIERQEEFVAAVSADFNGRARQETLFSEIFLVAEALDHARRNLREWMEQRTRDVALTLQPARAWVLPQPLGVIGIVAPWNFPLLLTLTPLCGALAAGNRVMLKPSEFTPATAAALARMIVATFPDDQVTLVTGDAEVGRAFTCLPFDHLLFTGSTTVGRQVMLAAAEHLTPVTLELGGKCPVLIAADADLNHAASEIAYGKLINCGQACTAPDYVLVPRDRMDAFAEAFRKAALGYYPDGAASVDYTSILRPPHAERLVRLLAEARARGVRVHEVFPEAGAQRLGPALLFDPPDDLAVMREEIFGPLLPLKPYDSLDEALAYVNARPRPLALYLFSRDRRVIERVLARTVSGGAVINDTMVQVACESLPFGGVGASGMGRYHGREGFDTFSHLKPVFARRRRGFAAMLRPPTKRMHEWFRRLTLR